MKKFDVCMIAFVDIATDARTLNISAAFAKNGHSVAVIGTGHEPIPYNNNVEFFLFPDRKDKKTWQRWLYFYRNSMHAIKSIQTKIVFAEDVYSLPIAAKIAKQCNAKLIYDSREIYSAIGPLSHNSIKQNIISYIEKKYIKSVDEIIVTAERDADYLKEHLTDRINYTTIKNLPPYMDKSDSDIIRNKFSIPHNAGIVLYQGMLLSGRGIEKTIEAVLTIKDAVFVILGEGPLHTSLANFIKKNKLEKRIFLAGAVPYKQLHEWTCSADVGIALIEPVSKSYELALPNKLFEYIMARIPTLCSDLPAMKEVIIQNDCGKYVEYNISREQLASVLKELLDNKKIYADNCDKAAHKLSFEKQDSLLLDFIS